MICLIRLLLLILLPEGVVVISIRPNKINGANIKAVEPRIIPTIMIYIINNIINFKNIYSN